MSTPVAVLLFCGGLLLSLMSSVVLSERLDQVGHRFRLPPGLIGLVTALGADSPEISSAAAAIIGGQHDLGRGVIFGSNIFNVAMLLGLSAVVAGRVAMGRTNLGFNAGVALCLTLVVGAQMLGWNRKYRHGAAVAGGGRALRRPVLLAARHGPLAAAAGRRPALDRAPCDGRSPGE